MRFACEYVFKVPTHSIFQALDDYEFQFTQLEEIFPGLENTKVGPDSQPKLDLLP